MQTIQTFSGKYIVYKNKVTNNEALLFWNDIYIGHSNCYDAVRRVDQ